MERPRGKASDKRRNRFVGHIFRQKGLVHIVIEVTEGNKPRMFYAVDPI